LEEKFKEDFEQVSIRETNENEPFEDASLRGTRRQNQMRVVHLGQARWMPDDWAGDDRR
jgi:hypothetical protein